MFFERFYEGDTKMSKFVFFKKSQNIPKLIILLILELRECHKQLRHVFFIRSDMEKPSFQANTMSNMRNLSKSQFCFH